MSPSTVPVCLTRSPIQAWEPRSLQNVSQFLLHGAWWLHCTVPVWSSQFETLDQTGTVQCRHIAHTNTDRRRLHSSCRHFGGTCALGLVRLAPSSVLLTAHGLTDDHVGHSVCRANLLEAIWKGRIRRSPPLDFCLRPSGKRCLLSGVPNSNCTALHRSGQRDSLPRSVSFTWCGRVAGGTARHVITTRGTLLEHGLADQCRLAHGHHQVRPAA